IIMPKVPDDMTPTTATYEKLLTTIKNNGLKIRQAKDEVLELGDSKVEVFKPIGVYKNLNDYSIITRVTHGENTFLFTGDNEKSAEKDIVKSNINIQAKVFKLGHHGSGNSSSKAMLEIIDPEYGVISCGEGNSYGHPHKDALKRVNSYCDYVFNTASDSTIVFESDGKGLNVVDSKGNNLLK
ncbi:MAG: MBL fold metallo-hydrolase, partial [Clostridiales bacterium]|nr:MBL fold metallo-hydrolase [Clostridiales bacterium]